MSGGDKQGRGGLDDRDPALQSPMGHCKGLCFHTEENGEPGMVLAEKQVNFPGITLAVVLRMSGGAGVRGSGEACWGLL